MDNPVSMDDVELLRQARVKAGTLLDNLITQRDDLERAAARLASDQQELGRRAFENAIASARRTLEGIDGALRCATAPD
jgi:hypothetical protein